MAGRSQKLNKSSKAGRGSLNGIKNTLPGLLLSILFGIASIWSSEFVGTKLMGYSRSPISAVMVALILGMLVGNIVRIPPIFSTGITFAMKKILRIGIVLLGIRLSIGDVARLGAVGLPIVVCCIVSALIVTTLFAK